MRRSEAAASSSGASTRRGRRHRSAVSASTRTAGDWRRDERGGTSRALCIGTLGRDGHAHHARFGAGAAPDGPVAIRTRMVPVLGPRNSASSVLSDGAELLTGRP